MGIFEVFAGGFLFRPEDASKANGAFCFDDGGTAGPGYPDYSVVVWYFRLFTATGTERFHGGFRLFSRLGTGR
jgi:hypothetical protein